MPEKVKAMPKNPKLEEAREHMRAAHEHMHEVMDAWIPKDVRENRQAARHEFLLGLRSLLDAAIEHSEKTAK